MPQPTYEDHKRRRRQGAEPARALLRKLRRQLKHEKDLTLLMTAVGDGAVLQTDAWGTFYYAGGVVCTVDEKAHTTAPKLLPLPEGIEAATLKAALETCCTGDGVTSLCKVQVQYCFNLWSIPVMFVFGLLGNLALWLRRAGAAALAYMKSLIGRPNRYFEFARHTYGPQMLVRVGARFYGLAVTSAHALNCPTNST